MSRSLRLSVHKLLERLMTSEYVRLLALTRALHGGGHARV
jgi:hypothetical protein